MTMQFDVVIIGAGPSGLFSAFQAGMLGMKSAIIDSLEAVGGQCSALYPEKPIYDISLKVHIFSCGKYESTFKKIQAKVVVIAAGAGSFGPNRPPLENIETYEGKSVFYLVTNRENFAGKNIVIAGGGDSALDWAISLSEIADVSIVHRRNKFRAAPATVQKIHDLEALGRIKMVTNYQLHGLIGKDSLLEEVIVADLDGNTKSLKADILLPFFGLAQNLGPILDFGLNINNHHIRVSYPYFETNIKGIYAVGDVATYEGKLKLILTSFAESASALHHAYARVFDGKALHFEYSTTKGIKK